nr:alpha/beta hydrolase [Deinococcus sp.]
MTTVFEQENRKLQITRYGQGRPVIFIHGLSGSGHWWKRNLPAFTPHFAVYVVELVGYGNAHRQRSLGVQADARMIAAWLEQADLTKAALIGHSLGGQIATRVVALVPGRIHELVLACSTGLLRGNLVQLALKLPRAGVSGRLSFLPRILADSARAGLPNLWRTGQSLLLDDVTELLALMQVKTLVIWGGRDVLVPASLGRQLAQAIPGARFYEIPRAGHVVMVDAPEEFNRTVLDFLSAGG